MDKRVQRTRGAIRTALLSLLEEKPLEALTTTELCQRAGINRNTFYTHYQSLEAVASELGKELLASLEAALREGDREGDAVHAACQHVASNQELYRRLWQCSALRLADRTAELVCSQRLALRWTKGLADTAEGRQFMRFAVRGSMGLIEQWLYDGCRMPCEQLAALIRRFVRLGQQGIGRRTSAQ